MSSDTEMASKMIDTASETVDLELQPSDLLVSIFLITSIKSLCYCKGVFIKIQNILKIILLDYI